MSLEAKMPDISAFLYVTLVLQCDKNFCHKALFAFCGYTNYLYNINNYAKNVTEIQPTQYINLIQFSPSNRHSFGTKAPLLSGRR